MNINLEIFGLWLACCGMFCCVRLKMSPDNNDLITAPIVREASLLVFFTLVIIGLGFWISGDRK